MAGTRVNHAAACALRCDESTIHERTKVKDKRALITGYERSSSGSDEIDSFHEARLMCSYKLGGAHCIGR
ncbi:hypothetical protein M413DRAFT_442363 [Hebeloma cylindrosporum]|uniref:Uncharacterized protein n=1 Tax=Hebeloma cylindrosporum TaxID=76867 RepID=A0A0C2Y7C9_HEBCY|nr:hypothetical protein M413DRAFT_442363 [Hebeloma cylindrosporum h7]